MSKRIYFATDVHGSEQVWKKWLNSATFYEADVLMLCGDLTGKSIVPIIELDDHTYISKPFGVEEKVRKEEVEALKEKIRFSGYYPYVCDIKRFRELQEDPKKLDKLFEELMVEGLRRWLTMIDENVPKETTVYVSPGNDDTFAIDPVINESERVINPVGKVCDPCFDYEMITCEWSNLTPWNSPRECSEKDLKQKLEKEFKKVTSYEKLLCNFHCPPYGTRLDLAPKLDKNHRPVLRMGQPYSIPVGSKAVRECIEKYQPLMGLHGHIHESYASERIGRTLCVNPGSEYTQGILRGFIIDLSEKGIERWWKVEG